MRVQLHGVRRIGKWRLQRSLDVTYPLGHDWPSEIRRAFRNSLFGNLNTITGKRPQSPQTLCFSVTIVHPHQISFLFQRLQETPQCDRVSKTAYLCHDISKGAGFRRYVNDISGQNISMYVLFTYNLCCHNSCNAELICDLRRNRMKSLDEYYDIRAKVTCVSIEESGARKKKLPLSKCNF